MGVQLDFDVMLGKIKDKQWTLADIDWDEPGADLIRADQRDDLRIFMTDVMWIEHLGARMMGMLGETAPTYTLKEIYRYFHAEEQRHANAELALLHRWGMIDEGEIPEPSSDIKAVLNALKKLDDVNEYQMPFAFFVVAIPLLEVGLDGAFLKFLSDEVADPVFHKVFGKINNDESRHLAVGFAVMDLLGKRKFYRMLVQDYAPLINPTLLLKLLTLLSPSLIRATGFITRIEAAVNSMGLAETTLKKGFDRYIDTGDKSESTRRLPGYRAIALFVKSGYFGNLNHPLHRIGRGMNRFNELVPYNKEVDMPTYSKELSHEPVV